MTKMTTTTKRALADATVRTLRQPAVAEEVAYFVRSFAFRRFHPDNTLDKRVVLHEAVRSYLAGCGTEAVEEMIADAYDQDSARLELGVLVNDCDFLGAASVKAYDSILSEAPELCVNGAREVIGRTTLEYLVDEVVAADRSAPLDIAAGKQVTVCFIPGSSEVDDYQDIATTSWLGRSDSLSIFPDKTFLDFLSVVGLTKADWLAGVERNTTLSGATRMGDLLADRLAAWNGIEDWDASGFLDVEVDDIVAAVDACPYGFTPMIAFQMDAEDIFAMDFSESLEVTGGIVGLHDFTNGSGDPVRFEGTLKLSPRAGDMHLADDQPLGLIATHGFLSTAFQSKVRRVHSVTTAPAAAAPSPK